MDTDPNTPTPRDTVLDRVPGWGWLVLAVIVVAAAFRLGLGLEPDRAGTSAAAAGGGSVRGSLADYRVRLASGDTVALASGEPTVVMVSSVTCAFCAEAMGDFARMASGRPLPRLRVVTLEGAARGAPMLERHGLADVWHAGPLDGSGQTLLTFQFPGTPTFLLLDGDGAVRAALPGYPGAEAIEPWFRIMLGERASI